MKLAAIVVALVAAVGAAQAGNPESLGHPIQFYRDGSFGDSTGSLRRVNGEVEDTVIFPTPAPTGLDLPTPAPTEASSGSSATPAPTYTKSFPTPAPTTTSSGSVDESAVVGELGVAYSVTRDEVESSSSSYTVPIAVAGCVAAVAAVAGVAFVIRKRKQQQETSTLSEGEAEYNDDISTPVV